MRKVILISIFSIYYSNSLIAQVRNLDSPTNTQQFKPIAKQFSTELGINLLGNSLIQYYNYVQPNFGSPTAGFKLRNFYKPNRALRTMLILANNSKTTDILDATNNKVGKSKESITFFGVVPGIELHFKGTSRLSPYIAFGLGYGFGIDTRKFENSQDGINYLKDVNTSITKNVQTINADILLGADYYITYNVFLGIEFGYNNYFSFFSGSELKYSGSGVNSAVLPSKEPDERIFSIQPRVNGFIRLGYVF
jgi:hypothetical protein